MEATYELVINVVMDSRVEPRLANIVGVYDAPTIDDVRRVALRLRTLRAAWREVALRVSRGARALPCHLDHAREAGALVRFDMRVVSREPLIGADAVGAHDARAKLEALSSALAGEVVALEARLYPTSPGADPLLWPVSSWPVPWSCACESAVSQHTTPLAA